MRLSRSACALLLAGFVAAGISPSSLAADEEEKAATPAAAAAEAKPAAPDGKATAPKPKKARAVRLIKPWRDMTTLMDSQKLQIAEIRRKSLDQIKQIEQREEAEIMALLNDEQRAEVQALKDKATAARKMKKPAATGTEPAAAKPAPAAEKAGG